MNVEEYIASGILELYVLGTLSPEEQREVENNAHAHPEIQAELDAARETMDAFAMAHAVTPPPVTKERFMDRIRELAAQPPEVPPVMHNGSRAEDYRRWLDVAEKETPQVDGIATFVPIHHEPACYTALVWVSGEVPPETHTQYIEQFLVLEGTCDVDVEGTITSYSPGDFFAIPLHHTHQVIVTSDIPCKFIMQRVAA